MDIGVSVRPMTVVDVGAAATAFEGAMADLRGRFNLPPIPRNPQSAGLFERRIAHLLATDPGGAFVAERDGAVVGISQAFVRDGFWVLSLLGVATDCQEHGIGRELLGAALDYANPAMPGTILCSRDPRAMSRYTRAGFDLHPAVVAFGAPRHRPTFHDEVRAGTEDDLAMVDAIDRDVRGAVRSADVRFMLEHPDLTLYVEPDRAYAFAAADRVNVVAGRDEESAQRVLESALSATTAENVEVAWITGPQQWALRTVVNAGMELHPHGPVMLRGRPSPAPSYLPNGAFG
jgi:GNAT superfamily N-acetyltransferase